MTAGSDHPSYETEFSGDDTGHIFDSPDTLPDTDVGSIERSVDTQSGFTVNLKNIDGRVALSVKRRVGTPPESTILFTPDESLKLSKILASAGEHYEYSSTGSFFNVNTNRRRGINVLKSSPKAHYITWWHTIVWFVGGITVGFLVKTLMVGH